MISDPARKATDLDNPSCFALNKTSIQEQQVFIQEVSANE